VQRSGGKNPHIFISAAEADKLNAQLLNLHKVQHCVWYMDKRGEEGKQVSNMHISALKREVPLH